jgi:hypothetical protein
MEFFPSVVVLIETHDIGNFIKGIEFVAIKKAVLIFCSEVVLLF